MRQHRREKLSAFIAAKRMTDDRGSRRRSTLTLVAPAPQHFTPERHHLTEAQCRQANELLRRAEQLRPLRGDGQQRRFRHAMRCAGIVSAVRRGVLGSRTFGRRLQGHRGGRVMRDHALAHLRAISPIGCLARQIARERRQAEVHYDATGQVLPIGAQPAATMEQQRIEDLQQLWGEAQWQTQQAEHLKW